jgi:hypothetical protein
MRTISTIRLYREDDIMKKVIYLALIVGFLVSFSVYSFAATTFDADGNHGTGIMLNFKTSKDVQIHVSSNATTYAAVSGHHNGDKSYGAASSDSVIYWQVKAEGTDPSDPSASDSSMFLSGWTGL